MIPDKRDIYSEFDQKRREYGVGKWMGKWVKRSYAFGVEGIPNGESEYLKVIYGFDRTSSSIHLLRTLFAIEF